MVTILNKSKEKAFDFMEMVFGILMHIYVLLNANLLIIFLVVVAYLIASVIYMVYLDKYSKEI